MHREKIVKEHLPALFRFAWALTGEDAPALTLAQKVIGDDSWQRPPSIEPHQLEIALFSCAYRRHTQGDTITVPPEHSRTAVISPTSFHHADRLTSDALLRSFRELELPQRAALVLFYTTKCSLQEIAAILNHNREEAAAMIARGKAEWLHILHREGGDLGSEKGSP